MTAAGGGRLAQMTPPPAAEQRTAGKELFLKERTGNVVENKGGLWKTRERSGNVHENTGI